MKIKNSINEARRGFWHLRKGGVQQFQEWLNRRQFKDPRQGNTSKNLWNPLDVEEYDPLPHPKTFKNINAAVILDDFSMQAWSYEFETVAVTPKNWQQEIDQSIDILLVESAWNGNSGAWQYQLTGPSAPSDELCALTAYCRQQGIPTVFWNKEDPPHFEDFLDTARLFDVVFTTDANKIDAYKQALGHDRIHAMSFAAQPAIHNPIRIPQVHQRGDIAFAGMYFAHKFPERRQQMELLLSAASQVSPRLSHGLTIFSRFAGSDKKYQFPEPFDQYVIGSLPYSKMLTAYRDFKVFLNVNSVTDSPSMCARRIFEITASGTPIVSTPSKAITHFFPADEVPTVEDVREAAWLLRSLVNSPQYRDRMVHKAQRRIWGEHTYADRAEHVLTAVEIPHNSRKLPSVAVVVSTNRPRQIDHVLNQIAHQHNVVPEILIISHGFELNEGVFQESCTALGIEHARHFSAPKEWSLGACLNKLISEATSEVIAKFDDDDLYGPHYLLDQLNALRYSGADVVGKEAAYAYLGVNNSMLLRRPSREHRWTNFVAGPTLVGYRSVFERIPFADITHGEDSIFLTDAVEAGMKIYAADRFNFVQVRGHGEHTWSATDAELMANGIVESFGLNTEHVYV